MGDQQERLGDDKIWFAGLMDGEGSINISRVTRKNTNWNTTIIPCSNIVNTDQFIINECVKILKNEGISYNLSKRKKRADHHKEIWSINIFGLLRNLRFLPWILPELRGYKKVIGEKVLEFCNMRHKNTNGLFKGITFNSQEISLINEILHLQKPGILNDYTSNTNVKI